MTKNKRIKLLLTITILSLFHCAISARNPLDSSQPLGAIYQLLPIFFPSLKPSSAKEMKTYFIPSTGSNAVITGTKMSLIVPYSTDLSSLSAEFYHTGKSATVNGIEQISGQTLNSYSQALVYTITAANATQKSYTLSTAKGSPDSNALLGFQFESINTKGLISGTSVLLNVPYGTDLKNLIPTFSHNGSKVFLNATEQVSGKTANDFSSPLLYEIQAENGSRKQYTTVVVSGTLTSNTIQGISVDGIEGAISGDNIYFNFPTSQNISSVSPIISHLGSTITVNGQPFVNGETTLDLTLPQKVKVTSADGTVKEYTVYSGYVVATGTGTGTTTGTGTATGTGTTTGAGTGTGVAPSSLTYAGSPFVFTQNATIVTQTPTVTGTITNCIASPALPTGLILDATTCAISGTPTVTQATNNYAIVASNASGFTAAVVTITVNIPPPSALSYTGSPYTFTRNLPITPQTPTVSGTVTNCTASPALPTGLTINATTCAISGTPTVIRAATNHTITASNSIGNTTTVVNIAVNIAPPSALTYTGSPYTFTLNLPITTQTPTVSGTVTNCMASPTLPTGLSLNTTTCVISGTPTVTQPTTDHTITASNSSGNTTTIVKITVNIAAPSALTYTGSPYTITLNAAMVTRTPTVTGTVTNCTANPTLPTGLNLNATTCAISGTPTVTQTATDHTITASNAIGNTTAVVNLTVNTASPSVTYTGNYYAFAQNTAVTTQTPTAIGTVTNCTVNPSLPTGLNLNTTTCEISGTPTVRQATANYIITASNAFGNTTSNFNMTIIGLWIQEAYVKAPNTDSADFFGIVSISSDTIVVGAVGEDANQTTITNGVPSSNNNLGDSNGAAYVFKRTGTTWALEAYLKAPNSGMFDRFGSSVSVSSDTIVVGAYQEDSNQTTINNGTTANTDNNLADSGAVYVFKRTGTTWAQEAYLKASNASAVDHFGGSVSVSSDTIVVGAPAAAGSGKAYVFKRTGTTWAQEAILNAPNAEVNDNFGSSVYLSSDTIVVGAEQEDSNQTTITNGTTASADNLATDSGAVYVFKRTGTVWAQEAYLKASNAEANDKFGYRVSVSSDTIVVGAYQEDSNQTTITNGTITGADNSATDSGAVYVFKRTGTVWAQEAYLKASNAEANDNFGSSVYVSSDTIAVGAEQESSNQTTITGGTTASADNSLANSGAVYVFQRTGTIWSQEAYLKAPNANAGDRFGNAVSISSDTIVVSASNEDSFQTTITNGTTASGNNSESNSGAVYVFRRK